MSQSLESMNLWQHEYYKGILVDVHKHFIGICQAFRQTQKRAFKVTIHGRRSNGEDPHNWGIVDAKVRKRLGVGNMDRAERRRNDPEQEP